jgi:TRAP-type C4-dicarboxylate transport system substrate-binding protein
MRSTKRLLSAAIGGIGALSLSPNILAADITLKFAGVLPVEHYAHKMMEQIETDIEAANVGLQVKLFPASQ